MTASSASVVVITSPPPTPKPIFGYDFPCSPYGTPRFITGIGSSFSPLGEIRRPIVEGPQANTTIHSIVTTTTEETEDKAEAINDELEMEMEYLLCPYRGSIDGIASKTILESNGNMEELRSYLDSTNNSNLNIPPPMLAVEVWFTPFSFVKNNKEEEETLFPIVSIASPIAENDVYDGDGNSNSKKKKSQYAIDVDPCYGTQLMIGQRGEYLEIVYRDHFEYRTQNKYDDDDDDDYYYNINNSNDDFDSIFNPLQYACRVLRLTQWNIKQSKIHHLVIVWKESGSILQIYGNGESIVTINMSPDFGDDDNGSERDSGSGYYDSNLLLRSWDPTYRLQFFSNYRQLQLVNLNVPAHDDTTVFPGMIHRVASYNEGLDRDDTVRMLFQEGIEFRRDPFSAFFGENPNYPLFTLVASSSSTHEQKVLQQQQILQPQLQMQPNNNNKDEREIANGNGEIIVLQGQSVTINVGAADVSNSTTALWDVMVELLQIPLYGDLLTFSSNDDNNRNVFAIGRVGDRILLKEGQMRTELTYQNYNATSSVGGKDYFSVPTHSYNGTTLPFNDLPSESFSYRLVAVRKGNHNHNAEHVNKIQGLPVLLGQSDSVRQELIIIHRNHPSTLQGFPEEVIQPERQASGVGDFPFGTLGNNVVLLDEADYDIDRVRVQIWTHNGSLTIDLDDDVKKAMTLEITDCHMPSLHPVSSTRSSTNSSSPLSEASPASPFAYTEICDGRNDRNMTFLATPTDVSKVLSNIRYNAFNWDRNDSITIRIFDGSCLSDDDESYFHHGYILPPTTTPIHDECFLSVFEIRVPAISFPIGHGSSDRFINGIYTFIVSGLVVILLGCCCCCCIWSRMLTSRLRRERRTGIEKTKNDDTDNRNAVLEGDTNDENRDFRDSWLTLPV